jgi:hypothetical protein
MAERMVNQSAHRGHSRDVVVDPREHADHMRSQLRVGTFLWLVTKI